MASSSASDLIAAIDQSVVDMLARCAEGKGGEEPTVGHVKAVEAAVKWAQARAAINPPDTAAGPSKFDRLRKGFNGGGNGRASNAAGRGGGSDPDDPDETESRH